MSTKIYPYTMAGQIYGDTELDLLLAFCGAKAGGP